MNEHIQEFSRTHASIVISFLTKHQPAGVTNEPIQGRSSSHVSTVISILPDRQYARHMKSFTLEEDLDNAGSNMRSPLEKNNTFRNQQQPTKFCRQVEYLGFFGC